MQASEYIYGQVQKGQLDAETGKSLLEEILPDDIAIVGMSCEYSDVRDAFEFYQAIKHSKRGFKTFPQDRVAYIPKDHSYLLNGAAHLKTTPEDFLDRLCKEQGAYLEEIDNFDYEFFGMSREEARYVDPTHRLVMKHSYLALEDAGLTLDRVKDSRTAIYIGKDKSITASYRSEIEEDSTHVNAGNWEGILASRLNYLYNLSGGSFVIDTACSSSLVAAHLAVKTLRDHEIDSAIVGGIALGLFPRQGSVIDQYSNVETPRSFLKVFDAESQGTIFGEGVGIVILKRLKDAVADNDNIHAVIRGSMINSDGRSNGLTAPNPHAQKDLLIDAYERSGISPETVEYIDAHGTGTKLGDPIEARGLTDAYKKYVSKRGFCALTSLKENIGHTVGAAGVGGLIKMSLALENQEIFPNRSFEAPNEYIRFVDSPFYIPTEPAAWVRGKYPRRGGVSSFGFSGTNAHVILEEYERKVQPEEPGTVYPFLFSAPTAEQLLVVLNKFDKHADYLNRYRLKDLSYTLLRRRDRHPSAVGFLAASREELADKLRGAAALLRNSGTVADGIAASEGAAMSADMKKLTQHRLRSDRASVTAEERLRLALDGLESAFDDFPYGDAVTVSLPGFEFKRVVLWANVKTYSRPVKAEQGQPVAGRLIRRQTLRSEKTDVYQVTLHPDDWFVDDHRIGGKRTFSGTTYTQLASELAVLYYKTPAYTLDKLYFKSLIQLDDKTPKSFSVLVHKLAGGQLEVEAFSYEGEALENYTVHAVFSMRQAEAVPAELSRISTDSFGELAPAVLGAENNSFFKGRWDFFGHNFQMDFHTPGLVRLSLDLNPKYADDLKEYHLHPSILDGLMGAMVYERAQECGKTYLPLSYGKFTFTGVPFTRKVYSVTEMLYNPAADHDVITGNVSVYTEDGQLIAFVDKYSMKAFANVYFRPQLHTVRWEPSSVAPKTGAAELAGTRTLIVGDPAAAGIWTEGTADVTYADYRQELTAGERYDAVIYAPWLSREEETEAGQLDEELGHYFRFAKAVPKLLRRGGKLIAAAGRGLTASAEGTVDPLQYALLSSARILGMENTGFSTIMVQSDDFSVDRLIGLAMEEELAGKKLILKNGVLYEETLAELGDTEPNRFELSDGDIVVVTGGYGGIGLEYAEELQRLHSGIRLAVLGRTDTLAVLSAKETRTAEEEAKLLRLQDLAARGEMTFHRCDLASEEEVRQTLEQLAAQGPIAGVVHLAGVPEDGMLFSKTREQFRQVTGPKVTGTALLRRYTREQPLRFFVASSSMTTIAGSPGQFAYTLANAYLEGAALADNRMTAVQWPGWSETGMALAFGDMAAADEHLLMKSLPTLIGREYIKLSLGAGVPRIIAGEFNRNRAADYLGPYMQLPQTWADAAEAKPAAAEGGEAGSYAIKSYDALTLVGADSQDTVEQFVTVVFASVLDLQEVDVDKSFTDLGGDSLKAFGIYKPIAEQFRIDMEVADVFIYPTVRQLSGYVREQLEVGVA
ncbi:SDR family oxidoreductase [Paenibacillus spiritus]|uniref:SDR family oxidoreductase n=1 Tax=Paenibacillus spiritus TaxID=2496557 RepID=A0A5J5FXW9_9BACL|nr:SDR family NAD(P)-dependent oxidoreductase [Paenibacillus spiritus]KAA8998813.1 SDR family oxidoreductase [Paenibacillus spiritus]